MPRSYAHLDLDERRRLATWHEAKFSVREIALRLRRDASTLYRELKLDFFRDAELPELNGYHAVAAQEMAERRRAVYRKMVVDPTLKLAVVERIKDGWTPEQIAYRMIHENARPRVCQETIYRGEAPWPAQRSSDGRRAVPPHVDQAMSHHSTVPAAERPTAISNRSIVS